MALYIFPSTITEMPANYSFTLSKMKVGVKLKKKWFVENRWLPAVNAVKEKYDYPEWHFIEIANDERNMKNQFAEKIATI